MHRTHNSYEITDDQSRLDFALIHSWLTETYWSTGITRPKVEQAARHSTLVVSAYVGGGAVKRQVGYCRVVSDRTRFAWLADLFVDSNHRGKGPGRAESIHAAETAASSIMRPAKRRTSRTVGIALRVMILDAGRVENWRGG